MARLSFFALLALSSYAVNAATTCSADSHCPSTTPCCSEYGFCGDDEFCLGGCNPLHSYSLTSCRPEPICSDQSLTFTNDDAILTDVKAYDGNATTHSLVVDKGNVFVTSANELVLTLTKENNGTRLSTTRYLHYGEVTATIKTARSAGVVNAFITMSDVKDEIDWEWPGQQTTEAQSNYFWLGMVDYSNTNGKTHSGLTDTFSNYHDYTINWTPDTLTWSIDGEVVRTINKADTLSADKSYYEYPTTPARVQLSIWPAGIQGNPQGTIDWAGGLIDWNDPDYVAQGHFALLVKSLKIKCAQETSATSVNGTIPKDANSYIYTKNDTSGLTPQVYVSNSSTLVNGSVSGKTLPSIFVGSAVAALGLVVSGLMM